MALPLLFGTNNAAIEMRSLSTASERLVTNGVAATQYTQAIVRQVASLERTARLFQILRRPAMLETFAAPDDQLMRARHGADRIELQAAQIAYHAENAARIGGGRGIVQVLTQNEQTTSSF